MTETIRYIDFPDGRVEAMIASSVRSYPRHTHDQFGIGAVDAGIHSSWSGRGQVEAHGGDMICCNPGEVTDGRAGAGVPRRWRMIYIDTDLMRDLVTDIREADGSELTFVSPVFSCARIRALYDAVWTTSLPAEAQHTEMRFEAALLALASSLLAQTTFGSIPRGGPVGSIARALARIDASPAARLTLADLARETNLSRFQLLRAFRRTTGLTPHAYILQRRLHLARRMIRGRAPLTEAALVAGFCDQAHLTRWFVRQFGVTPHQYARRGE